MGRAPQHAALFLFGIDPAREILEEKEMSVSLYGRMGVDVRSDAGSLSQARQDALPGGEEGIVAGAAPETELRPESKTVANPNDTEKLTPLWGYPATNLLVGINVTVFLIMCWHTPLANYWRHGVWSEMFTSVFDANRIVQFGGSDASLVLEGEWWRLVTATFVHANVLHLLLNMWCLWNLGVFGEPLLGRPGLCAVYLLTGAAGNLLSLIVAVLTHQFGIVTGASGAVFGFAGVLIILLSNRGLMEKNPGLEWKELSSLRLQVIFFAAVNLAFGYVPSLLPFVPGSVLTTLHLNLSTMPRVDNSAHLGGFLGGLALGVPLFPRMTSGKASYRARQRMTFAVAALILCLVGYAVKQASK